MYHCCRQFKLVLIHSCMQGFWKGVLPSIVMVSNPSVNYMLYEYLRARLEDWRRALTVSGGGALRQTTPTGAHSLPACGRQCRMCLTPVPYLRFVNP